MRIIVAGAVAWVDSVRIKDELAKLPPGSIVIHGDAPGADALAGKAAEELGLVCQPFRKEKQDYQKYKRAAWKSLNERMLASGADLVLAFHPAIDESRGARHLVEIARGEGVEVLIIAR